MKPSCVVPRLLGKTLHGATKALQKANCRLGKVKPKVETAGTVVKQRPKPGKVRPVGTKVKVKLG